MFEFLHFNSSNIFLKDSKKQVTFKQFESLVIENSKKISKQLGEKKNHNSEKSNLILIDIADPFTFAIYTFSCLYLKLRPALINSYFKESQIKNILEENHYSLIITDKSNLYSCYQDIQTLNIKEDYFSSEPYSLTSSTNLAIPLDSEIIFFTSGSMESKACVLTLRNLVFNALGSAENISFTSSDSWGLCLPLFHVGGFSILIRALVAKAKVCILDNKKSYADQIRDFLITHVSFVSTQFARYIQEFVSRTDLKNESLKCILLGGSAISEDLLAMAIALKLPIYKSYGMTEMGSQVCTTKKIEDKKESLCSGSLLKYRELKIENREIYVRGPCLFKGYLSKNKSHLCVDLDGWFFTKDLGEMRNGNLVVFGRSDRIFQSGGENISPEVIEQELLKISGVKKAYVCSEVDPVYGMVPVAYIEKEETLQNDTIHSVLEKTLSGFYRPKDLRPWSTIPHQPWKH